MKLKVMVHVLVLAAVLAVTAAWGQGGGAAAAPKAMAPAAPAMAATAPAMAPTAMAPTAPPNPALAQLNFFAGSWQCAGTGYMDGKGHPTGARVTMGWELNGYFMSLRYEEQKTDVNPMPLTAVEHWGYGDELKKLVAGQVDSMGGYGTQASAGWEGD
ncbi:MAG TPA: hypothetical protein VHG32_02825 [Thermoanaerobaculia bacterium]|nr:hypothetical protein [Thermoanaerobaculia bacterium]